MALQVHGQGAVIELLKLIHRHPDGATQDDLQRAGWQDKNMVLHAINRLLAEDRIEMLTNPATGQLVYRAVDPNKVAKFRGLDASAKLVYQLIEEAGNTGLWSRPLKDKSNLQPTAITKITKDLIRRQLIKEVASHEHRSRKIFMLFDLQPSAEISGGNWYKDGEFAIGWVEKLRENCMQYFDEHAGAAATLDELYDHIISQPCGHSVPTKEDIEQILRTLELDEAIYNQTSQQGVQVYAQRSGLFDVGASRMPSFMGDPQFRGHPAPMSLMVPCLSCPLSEQCSPGGNICPEKCNYLGSWLSGAGENARNETTTRINDW